MDCQTRSPFRQRIIVVSIGTLLMEIVPVLQPVLAAKVRIARACVIKASFVSVLEGGSQVDRGNDRARTRHKIVPGMDRPGIESLH